MLIDPTPKPRKTRPKQRGDEEEDLAPVELVDVDEDGEKKTRKHRGKQVEDSECCNGGRIQIKTERKISGGCTATRPEGATRVVPVETFGNELMSKHMELDTPERLLASPKRTSRVQPKQTIDSSNRGHRAIVPSVPKDEVSQDEDSTPHPVEDQESHPNPEVTRERSAGLQHSWLADFDTDSDASE